MLPLAPLEYLDLHSCGLSLRSPAATCSHSSALCCHDQDPCTSVAFHSNIPLLTPSNPDLKYGGSFRFHSLLVLLYLFLSYQIWPPFVSTKTISVAASCFLVLHALVTTAWQKAAPGWILQHYILYLPPVTSRQGKAVSSLARPSASLALTQLPHPS